MKHPARLAAKSLTVLSLIVSGLLLAASPAGSGWTDISPSPQLISQSGKYESFTLNGDIRRFAGETLFYDVDFMIFFNAAEAQISFYKEDGKFKCLLVAQTKGFVGFLTSYVRHTYKATFEIVDNGKKLRTAQFEREIIVADQWKRIVHDMNHVTRSHHGFVFENDVLIWQFDKILPENINLDDVLGAFYNFRNEVYGAIGKGKSYIIPTFWTQSDQPHSPPRYDCLHSDGCRTAGL